MQELGPGRHQDESARGVNRRVRRWRSVRRVTRGLLAAAASWPVFQATGCFPDPLGALNFELQSLVNVTLLNALNTVVQNVLRL